MDTEENEVAKEQRALIDHVRHYYELVDSGEIDSLLQLFDDDAIYRRPGYQPMRGRRKLEQFYRGERVIETGKHTLTGLVVQRSRVVVDGEFAGVLKDGKQVNLRFADFFTFSVNGLFSERDTFFFVPAV